MRKTRSSSVETLSARALMFAATRRIRIPGHCARRRFSRREVSARRSDHCGHPRRDQERSDHLQGSRAGVHGPRQGVQRRLHEAGHRQGRIDSCRDGHGARRCTASIPYEDDGSVEFAPESGSVCRATARVRPNGGDRVGSQRQAAVRHGGWRSERRPTQRIRNTEYSRRALGHV